MCFPQSQNISFLEKYQVILLFPWDLQRAADTVDLGLAKGLHVKPCIFQNSMQLLRYLLGNACAQTQGQRTVSCSYFPGNLNHVWHVCVYAYVCMYVCVMYIYM